MTSESPTFDLHGKAALITGATRGLGRETALAFARAGADVMIASRRPDACEAVAAEVKAATGRRALGCACHVGRWAELERLAEKAWRALGRVDILVNNAGSSPLYESLDAVSEELWRKVIDVNLTGPFRLCALIGPRMAAAEGGSIINVSSVAANHPHPDSIPYAAAKAGLNALTVGCAHAFGPTVRVNAVLPGTFLTDVSRHWDLDRLERDSRRFALRRAAHPAELTGTMLYLASDASSYTTGALLSVDGGYRPGD